MKKFFANNWHILTNTRGFTLLELLVVISLIGILTGVTLSIINPKKQRNVAEDGVRQANLEKYALGLEAYADANANGEYPADIDGNGEPDGADVATFISRIPNDEPTLGVDYPYAVASDNTSFGVYVLKASNSSACYKYRSTWGKIKECIGVANCTGDTDGC